MTDERIFDLVQRVADSRLSRRRFMHRAAALGVSTPAIAALLAQGAVAAPGPRGTTRVRYQTDPKTLVIADELVDAPWITLDPAIIYEINPQAAMNVVYECLYHLPDSSKPTEFAPLLAADFPTFSADGTEVTITLRTGVKFHHSGNEMTAEDWIFSWNRLKGQASNPAFLADYLGTYEAVDAQTIRLKLEQPNAALVAILTSTPLSVSDRVVVMAQGGMAEATPEATDTRTWMTENSAGTGPYQIQTFDINTEVIVERHPEYWGDAPFFDRIIWRNVGDANAQLQLVQTGEADIAYFVDPDAIGSVESDPNLQIISGQTLNHNYLAMHTQADPGGPLANKQLRQAIGWAVDYDGIINGLSGGASVKPATVIPLGMLGTEEVKDQGYSLDLAKAQELFDASGVGPVSLTLSYDADGTTDTGVTLETLMAKLQADLQKIDGLTIELAPMPSDQRLADYRAGKLQFTWSGWSPDYTDVHAYAEPFALTGGAAAKRVGFSNARIDELLAQAIAELDEEARKQMYIEVQQIMIDEAAFLVLEQATDRKVATTAIQGVQTHSVYIMQLRNASKTG